jgi:nucleolar protein 14
MIDVKNRNVTGIRKANLVTLLTAGKPNEQAKIDLLGLSFDLLGKYADMYKGLDGFLELHEPILDVLGHIDDMYIIDDLRVSTSLSPLALQI